jgi:hypothetical protein
MRSSIWNGPSGNGGMAARDDDSTGALQHGSSKAKWMNDHDCVGGNG